MAKTAVKASSSKGKSIADRVPFSQAKADQIVDEVLAGRTLSDLHRDPRFPDRRTFNRWMHAHPSFAVDLARARRESAATIEDSTVEIEDQVLAGTLDSQAAYTVLRNRHWRARVRDPSQYGDKLQLDADLRLQVSVADPTRNVRQAAPVAPQGAGSAAALLTHAPTLPALLRTQEDPESD